ncbi:MAG: c-type cytochrome biogenesis protein CcmI [Pseudomonadota bacterium]
MTTFWIICALLLVVAVLFVGVPLWRGTSRNNAVARDAANLEIYRDQIAEMDADLRNGLLTPELHEQGTRELQARLLDEVHSAEQQQTPVRHPIRVLTVVIALILPLASIGLYMQLGSRDAFEPQAAVGTGFGGLANTEAALAELEQNAAQNPEDPDVLVMLARSYVEFGRYADGARVYGDLTKLVPDIAILWADYADALGMTHGTLRGEPTQMLERALQLDPDNLKALALSGTAAMERGEYAAAIRHWEKLRSHIPEESEDAQMIGDGIKQAQHLLAQSKGGRAALDKLREAPARTLASAKASLSGTVTLSDALKGRVDPNDTLFVLARAAQGPKMPLAVIRKQVKDLPLSFTLDDSMAMSPEMSLSGFDQVVVVARISKSGNAIPQAGDMEGLSKPIASSSKDVRIVIDHPVR